jgi:catechol 2,3-dioxygenase-like lactoylglutathione lyase family enzyme
MQHIGHITLLVHDYDESIEFFTKKLKFRLVEDKKMSETKRWIVIASGGSNGSSLLLTKAITSEQKNLVGKQAGGKVFIFLFTDNISADYENLKSNGVEIIEEPEVKPHGRVLIFADLYGNHYDLIEPNLQE